MGKQIQKPGIIGKILIWGGILLSIAAYLVIVIPGLYNKTTMHKGDIDYYNIGMWKIDYFGTVSLSVVGIIGIILFALAFISTIGGIILRKGGKAVSIKLMITSLVVLFVATLVFIMIIISKPDGDSAEPSLIWGGMKNHPEIHQFLVLVTMVEVY
jgi:magnesium-transporting ATPase (P-type)